MVVHFVRETPRRDTSPCKNVTNFSFQVSDITLFMSQKNGGKYSQKSELGEDGIQIRFSFPIS